MAPNAKYEEYTKKEIEFIDGELKDWFLTRRFNMERNMALKKTLDTANFTGLSQNNASVPDAQRVLWSDLVQGKPEMQDSLSTNAKQMKAEMYTTMFKDATDYDHPCRVSGASYMRCLSDNYKQFSKTRQATCMASFKAFDGCRKETLDSQAKSIENALVKQDIADRRAKSLFERRSILMDTQKC